MEQFIDSIELSLRTHNWHAAVISALILPDIAGWVDSPTQSSGARYEAWFEAFVAPKYLVKLGPDRTEKKFLSGRDCYALRCALLHEGRDDTSKQRSRDILNRFHFVVPSSGKIHCNLIGSTLQLQVQDFCRDICDGIKRWRAEMSQNDTAKQERLTQLVKVYVQTPNSGISLSQDSVRV